MIPQHPPVPAIPRKLGLHLGLRLGSKVGVSAPDITAPTITSGNTANNVENTVLAHALTANEGVTWAIRTAVQNGASVDHDKFELSGSTLRWASNGTKDYETPNDTGSNNTYVVVVRATDGASNTTDQTITVTVTDSAPATPTLTWTSGTAAYDPTFSLTEIAEDDVVELQIDDVNTFASLFDSDTNTIDAAEALSGSLTFSGISSLTPGTTFYARARYQRDGEYSAWSNIVSKAMDAASWDPTDLASLAAWYDADQQTDGADSEVASFTDRSGNGHHFSNGTSNQRPLLRHSAINGKKALDFDDANDVLTCATGLLNGATASAFFAVVKMDADPPSGGGAVIDGFSTSGSNSHHPFTDGTIYDGFGSTVRKTCGNPTPSLTSTSMLAAISGASDYRFLVNDATLHSTATNTVGIGTGTRYMGNSAGFAAIWGGLVAEVIVLNAVPSAGDIANIRSYFNTKFGTAF